MKLPFQIIKEIEETYKVENIKVGDFCIWQILRLVFSNECWSNIVPFYYIEQKKYKGKNKDFSLYHRTKDLNVYKLLCNYDTWLFSDDSEERLDYSTGKYFIGVCGGIEKYFKNNLLVVTSMPKNYRFKSSNKYIAENRITNNFLAEVMPNFVKLEKYKIENKDILDKIISRYKFKTRYKIYIDSFFKYVKCFELIFKIKKPNAIFLICYYNIFRQALIYSAKNNKIKTIEIQHGTISENNEIYNIYKNIGNESFPEFIFTFGEYSSKFLKNNFVNYNKIFSIGNYYLQYNLDNNALKRADLINYFNYLKSKYNKIVLITGHIGYDKQMLEFINKLAFKDNNILYMYIPRLYNNNLKKYIKFQNIILENKFNFYECVSFCDFHATIHSACFLEALKFGKISFIIDITKYEKYLLSDFKNSKFIIFVDSPEEMYNKIVTTTYDEKEVKKYSCIFYRDNCYNNLKKAINELNI